MKALFSILLILLCFTINGQIIFEEKFESKNIGFNLASEGYELTKISTYSGTVTAEVIENSGNKYARMEASPNGSAQMQIAKPITIEPGKVYTFDVESKDLLKGN
tara:strand:- start:270 stop:584 length:315 start_codon:yes stop_codon:yes gene_type:complete